MWYQHSRVHEVGRVQDSFDIEEQTDTRLTEFLGQPVTAQASDTVVVGDSAAARDSGLHRSAPAISVYVGHVAFAVWPGGKREIEIGA